MSFLADGASEAVRYTPLWVDSSGWHYVLTANGHATVIINKYVAEPVKVTLGGTKVFEGFPADKPLPTFTFELIDAGGTVPQTKETTGSGTFTFDEMTFDKTGTYTYTVKETIPSDAVNNVKDGERDTKRCLRSQ